MTPRISGEFSILWSIISQMNFLKSGQGMSLSFVFSIVLIEFSKNVMMCEGSDQEEAPKIP
jgi:hypothetical protein